MRQDMFSFSILQAQFVQYCGEQKHITWTEKNVASELHPDSYYISSKQVFGKNHLVV